MWKEPVTRVAWSIFLLSENFNSYYCIRRVIGWLEYLAELKLLFEKLNPIININ
jgi:hypothetical protein